MLFWIQKFSFFVVPIWIWFISFSGLRFFSGHKFIGFVLVFSLSFRFEFIGLYLTLFLFLLAYLSLFWYVFVFLFCYEKSSFEELVGWWWLVVIFRRLLHDGWAQGLEASVTQWYCMLPVNCWREAVVEEVAGHCVRESNVVLRPNLFIENATHLVPE